MKDKIIAASELHFKAHILKHKMNVEIMMDNPMAIHDLTDLMSAIEQEISKIAEYEDKLDVLEKHFRNF